MLSEQTPNEEKRISNPEVWSEDESDDSTLSSSSSSDTSLELPVVTQDNYVPKKKSNQSSIKTKGELSLDELPPIENLTISVEEDEIKEVGKVYAIIEKLVVVRSYKDERPLDIDSILFLTSEKPLGKVFDVFGPIGEPFYSVRFNSTEDITEKNVVVDAPVFFAPSRPEPITRYVFLEQLQNQKGSDASWKDNNEPPEEHLDYSDDEQESLARKKRHPRNRTPLKNSEDVPVETPVISGPLSNESSAVPASSAVTSFARNPQVTMSSMANAPLLTELWRPPPPLQVVNQPLLFLHKPPPVFRFNALRPQLPIQIGPTPVPSTQNIFPIGPIPNMMRPHNLNVVGPNPVNQQNSYPANQPPILVNQQSINQLHQDPIQQNFSQVSHNATSMNQNNHNQMFKNPNTQIGMNSSPMSQQNQWNGMTQRYPNHQNLSQINQRNIPMNQHRQGFIQPNQTGPYDAQIPIPPPTYGPISHSMNSSYPVLPHQTFASNPWPQSQRPIHSPASPMPNASWFSGSALTASPAPNVARSPLPPCSPLSIQIPSSSGAPSPALGPFSFQLLPRPSPVFFSHAGQNTFFKN
ncbi:H/ACA ribonucleoprotein complex non-core subunit NAF1-like [Uloborus diversus]|uniref:H/ACA ribonucleoprotein complex non-core subunit NAF1-like n=1 Tax=Uloborus diversus TaxID=327109 RepID=UPI002409FF85|nr:H/ACA ribonucleoprotein complex non-core subunit NAF1-like [Uloborus diversus]